MARFRLANDADTNNTSRRGEVFASPKKLVERFGTPDEVDGYKTSGSFSFMDEAGNCFTVYDLKSTSLFEDDLEPGQAPELPTPQQFWAAEKKYRFQIGGRKSGDVAAFKQWLLDELK